jgi:hypothetical protein
MSKCKTSSEKSSRQPVYTRHRWKEDFTCERCGKTRNPLAGLKMFRPVKSLDKVPVPGVLCVSSTEVPEGEQQ